MLEKIAVIEIDSIYVTMCVWEVENNKYYNLVKEFSHPIKLQEDIDESGFIKPNKNTLCNFILKSFKIYCDKNEIKNIITYARNFVKDIKNQNSFIDEIYNYVGLRVKILNSEEEVSYAYSALVNTIDVSKGLFIDLSNSETKFVFFNKKTILDSYVLDEGILSINKNLSLEDGKVDCDKVFEYFIKKLDNVEILKNVDQDTKIFVSGDAFNSAVKLCRKVSRYPIDLDHNYQITNSNMKDTFDLIKTLDVDKTKKIKGISSDRADVLATSVSILYAITNKYSENLMHFSAYRLIDGVMFSNIKMDKEKPFFDMLENSLENNMVFFSKNSTNNKNILKTGLMLFSQLKVLHKLNKPFVKAFKIACILNDCGNRICYECSSSSAFDIVLKSKILGVGQKEIILASFIVTCQNLEDLDLSTWMKYNQVLTEEDLQAVRKLGVILKLATYLDYRNFGLIQDISCDLLGDSVIIKTTPEGNIDYELYSCKKIMLDFKRVFKKGLEVL